MGRAHGLCVARKGLAGFLLREAEVPVGLRAGAALALAVVIWIAYGSADHISRLMGPRGSRTVTRLSAFMLLCIGVRILITGVEDVLGPLLAQR